MKKKVGLLMIAILAVICAMSFAACGENNPPEVKTLSSIAITTPPTKTTYIEGESFDKTGMVVSAKYSDDSSENVTNYTVDKTILAVSDTKVQVSYSKDGITKTANVSITVNANIDPVENAQTPNITLQPQGATVTVGNTYTLSVTASVTDGGTLAYQWYSNLANSATGGTAISGAVSASYAVPTTTAGTVYYYVIVTNTNNAASVTKTATAISNVALVTVENEDNGHSLIAAEGFEINGVSATIKMPNSTTVFDFNGKITVSTGASWIVTSDAFGQHSYLSKTMPLEEGDNTVYLWVTGSGDTTMYTLTLRRRPVYTVSFETNVTTEIATQSVEEDNFATAPNNVLTRTGYTFEGWDYDFDVAISDNIIVKAVWNLIAFKYIDASGVERDTEEVTTIISTASNMTLTGWFLLRGNVSKNCILTIEGTAHIILEDNCSWVGDSLDYSRIAVTASNTLYIYAQSTGEAMGKLKVGGNIGGKIGATGVAGENSGEIIINGGLISATNIGGGNGTSSGSYGGNGSAGGNSGAITINGGTISATHIGGGNGGSGSRSGTSGGTGGIGGNGGNSGTITINGGNISASIGGGTGGRGGSGGGGGIGGTGGKGGNGTVIINGGIISATRIGGGVGGIGGEYVVHETFAKGGIGGIGGDGIVTVTGGKISASIGGGAGGVGGAGSFNYNSQGYNGGAGGNGGKAISVTISGGIINGSIGGGAGGNGGAGGYNYNNPDSSTSGGNSGNGGNGGNSESILISGGTISVSKIGGGNGGAGGYVYRGGTKGSTGATGANATVAITGGSIKATTITSTTNGTNNGSQTLSLVTVETDIMDDFIQSGSVAGAGYYGFNGVKADAEGKVYLWLPVGATKVTINGSDYPIA